MLKCWRNILIIAWVSLLLQACASTRILHSCQAEMQGAKHSFDSGNFKRAFCQLLPLAAAGCPEAQYALGYLYYYGYGVSEDTVSGLFWIEEAAKRHYIPAIKALKLIKQRKNNHDEPFHPSAKSAPDISSDMVSNQPVEDQTKPVKYTLQVFGSYELDTVKELQEKLQLQDSMYRGLTKHKGRDWYILTYGKFPAILQAELAKDQLPKGLKELKPWVRQTNDLQWLA